MKTTAPRDGRPLPQQPLPPPPAAELRRIGIATPEAFRREGEAAAQILHDRLCDHLGPRALARPGVRVLDVGAGIGRVALALHLRCGLPTDACDVNAPALSYLSRALSAVRCVAGAPDGPLPFAGGAFDALYALKVVQKLDAHGEAALLGEMARILRPGGVALVSVSGPAVLSRRRAQGAPGLKDATLQRLEAEGRLCPDIGPFAAGSAMTGPFAGALHSHGHILSEWTRGLEVKAIYPAAIDGLDDLIALSRP